MKQNSPKYYKVYTAADGRVCIASVEFAADFGANAPENCPCMGYIKVMHGNKRADAPCYLMPEKMAKLLKPEEYRPAPTGGSSPAAPKSRPDAATMTLYWLLTEAAAFADAEPQRVFENGKYKLIAKEAPDMLKRLKREFNITKSDLKTYPPTVAPAPVQDQQQPEPAAALVADAAAVVFSDSMDDAIEARTSEDVTLPDWAVDGVRCVYDSRDDGKLTGTADRFHWSAVGHCWLCDFTSGHISIIGALVERMAPAPVEDIEAAVVAHFEDLAANAPDDDPAADILRAGIETGKVIICSVPKAEPTTPTSEKTEPTPTNEKTDTTHHNEKMTTAEDYLLTGAYPIWYERNLQIEHVYNRGKYMGTATENIGTIASWGRKQIKVAWVTGKKNVYTIRDFFELVESGKFIVSMPYDTEYMASLKQPTPTEQKNAPTDAEVLETAARIRANYEAMQADIEAEREQAAAAFAEAITAYCEELSRPEPLAWEPETIIIPFEPRPAAEVDQPRRRHRLNLQPRLSRWLHPARWVAVAFVVCLLSGLLLGMNTSTAAADDIAAAYELAPVTVTAETPDTFIEDEAPRLIEDKAPCLIEDKAPAPSPVKKLAAPSPVKNAATDAVTLPGQKTAADIATATAPAADDADSLTTAPAAPLAPAAAADGLTICEGTPWAYIMMNWA